MITFKQYLDEIDHHNDVYSKAASNAVSNFKVDDQWTALFSFDGYTAVWKWSANLHYYHLVLVKDKTRDALISIQLKEYVRKVPGGTLMGVYPDSISSRTAARGKGLALRVYSELIKHGQILFSSDSQTTGSMKLWQNLAQSGVGVPFVIAEEAAARWYINRDKEHEHTAANVLLTGPYDALDDEAYASQETRWVILPHNTNGLQKFQELAIKLPQKPQA